MKPSVNILIEYLVLQEVHHLSAQGIDDVFPLLFVAMTKYFDEVEMGIPALCQINGVAIQLIEQIVTHLFWGLLDQALNDTGSVMSKH